MAYPSNHSPRQGIQQPERRMLAIIVEHPPASLRNQNGRVRMAVESVSSATPEAWEAEAERAAVHGFLANGGVNWDDATSPAGSLQLARSGSCVDGACDSPDAAQCDSAYSGTLILRLRTLTHHPSLQAQLTFASRLCLPVFQKRRLPHDI